MTPEQAIKEKWRRGEQITPFDHVLTIRHPQELDAFRACLVENGRITPEIQAAIYQRQKELGR